jgi:hypothetical protein
MLQTRSGNSQQLDTNRETNLIFDREDNRDWNMRGCGEIQTEKYNRSVVSRQVEKD